MSGPKIIALCGKMGAGKSEVASYLMKRIPTSSLVKLAQPLYDIQQYAYNRIGKEVKGKDRKLLQYLGTEWGRSIEPNLWVDIWSTETLHELMFNANYVITDDVRFDNEAMTVRSRGGIVLRVEADDSVRGSRIQLNNTSHKSEMGVDDSYVYATIYNNGTIDDLHKNLDYLLETLKVETNKS